MKFLLLKLVSFYQRFISPMLGNNCRFYPSCSEYARLSLKKDHLLKAIAKIVIRIFKCNPWHSGGVDLP
ncbi:MAG: membrane protein insertion efficiency factor YidD [Chlamydiales bacterium]|nr:membrane protein insertion efficiency factor YidD [Chlamydiales bacterium]NCF70099.1 membrane protein insertion efficiency factor YidD [Chlamydiales bacterium]